MMAPPDRQQPSREQLLRTWQERTLSSSWRVASDWLCPEVLEIARSATQATDFLAEARGLGQARAHQGVGMAEALADLFALFESLDRPADAAVVAAFAEAWAEQSFSWAATVSCTDPSTGLATRAHFRASMYEAYEQPRANPAAEHLVAMIRMPSAFRAEQSDDALLSQSTLGQVSCVRWESITQLGSSCLKAFEGTGATLSYSDGCIAVLMPRTQQAFRALQDCADALEAMLRAAGSDSGVRIDIEPLPADPDDVERVLDSLHR